MPSSHSKLIYSLDGVAIAFYAFIAIGIAGEVGSPTASIPTYNLTLRQSRCCFSVKCGYIVAALTSSLLSSIGLARMLLVHHTHQRPGYLCTHRSLVCDGCFWNAARSRIGLVL